LKWLQLLVEDLVRVVDSSCDIALEAGRSGRNSGITFGFVRFATKCESDDRTYILVSWTPHQWR